MIPGNWRGFRKGHLGLSIVIVIQCIWNCYKGQNYPPYINGRLQDIAILMYKVKNGLCPDYISRLFIIRNIGKYSVKFLGPVLWSKIDRKFRELKTVDQFKRVIRKIDLAKHILPTNCINCTLCYS